MKRASLQTPEGTPGDRRTLRLSDLLAPERIRVPLSASEKDAVLAELVDLVVESLGLEGRRSGILQAVREREGALSTGIGDGIALPHARIEGVSRTVLAAGVSAGAIEFGSLDGRPARLFFFVLSSADEVGSQVKVLSRISRLMRSESLRRRLIGSENAEQFLKLLREAESAS